MTSQVAAASWSLALGDRILADTDIDGICHVLERGDPIALPTDTVYGLCALPGVPGAVDRLFELKGRGSEAPVAVLCHSAESALELADHVTDAQRSVAAGCWPGSLTLVLKRRSDLDWPLGEPVDTIGVRVPASELVGALSRRLGPIAATSANRHGHEPETTLAGVREQLGLDLPAVDGGTLGAVASTVLDTTGPRWRIMRTGALSIGDLLAAGADL